ncbi:MAG TPA: ribosome small subunit-dependent GTPase A [Actinomycetes bacterium]|nr:ribosome small subunit-dependent GTPase A [Actinomycetes bacterium]
MLTPTGEIRAELSQLLLAASATEPERAASVGDLCVLEADGDVVRIVDLLPRRTAVTRASVTPGSSQRQVLAANVDVLAAVEPLNSPPSLGRIERLLTLAWESGAAPVVLLSKCDLDSAPEEWVREVSSAAPGAPVIAVSQRSGEGIEELRSLLGPGRILALVGPSGAGKSSLVNALAGETVMDTAAIREDGRGRHTTVHRELVVLADGSLVIDTPGLRSVGLASPEALDQVFADLAAAAELCRFNDCAHDTEPGCGVQAAIESGELAERRLQSWRKLQREAAYQERRTNVRLRAAEKEIWKQRTKEMRQGGYRPSR